MSCFGLIADTWLIHLDWLQANAGSQLATFGVGIGVGSYRCANLALLGCKFSTCSIVFFALRTPLSAAVPACTSVLYYDGCNVCYGTNHSAPSCLPVCTVEKQVLRKYIHTSGPTRLSSNLGFKLHFYWLGFLMD